MYLLKNSFRYSRFVSIIFGLITFSLNSLRHSRFVALLSFTAEKIIDIYSISGLRRFVNSLFYPAKLWGFVDRLNSRLNFNLLKPDKIFLLAYASFILLSSYTISLRALVFLLVTLVFFVFGFIFAKRVSFREGDFKSASLKAGVLIYLFSLLCLMLDIYYVREIPLFDPIARKKLSVLLTYTSTFIVLAGLMIASYIAWEYYNGRRNRSNARVKVFTIALTTTFLVTLLGFRTQTLVSLLGFTFVMYRYALIGNFEIISAMASGLLAISAMGAYRAIRVGYALGISHVIGNRVGVTLSIYNYIVNNLFYVSHFSGYNVLLTGVYHGRIALSTFSSFLNFIPGPSLGPRTIVAREFGVTGVTLTSTLLGPVSLDLGLIGSVLFLLILGVIIGLAFKNSIATASPLATAFFSILFAYLLVGIETGLVDFNVFVLFSASLFISIAHLAEGSKG
ncbi:hypothetical protein IPdc08_01496 [archaeon]|nr:hypothetical protein IPdc08_01496 [archaeon]